MCKFEVNSDILPLISDIVCRYEPNPITIENQRWDPLTASGSAVLGAAVDVSTAVSGLFFGLKSEFKQPHDSREDTGDRRAVRVAIKTSRSVAEIGGVAVKASLVDYPMALVDGLDGIPALLGGKTRQFEPVTDWRSGGRVACKVSHCSDILSMWPTLTM